MSWYSRVRSLVAHTPAKAADVEAELNNIAAAFNGLFSAGHKSASSAIFVKTEVKDVPGCSVTLAPTVSSLLFVWTAFDFTDESLVPIGYLNIDGSDRPEQALGIRQAGDRGVTSQSYCVKLTPGSHPVKLRANSQASLVGATVNEHHTGFTYLMIPDPEP